MEFNSNINKFKKSNNDKLLQSNTTIIQNNQNAIKKNLNNIFFELKSNSKSNYFNLSKSKNSKKSLYKRKRSEPNLNRTKKYKIFHNFLSVSIDTTELYTLDDEMNLLLLNPKITYNYPYNILEKELE